MVLDFCQPSRIWRASCTSCGTELGQIPLKAVRPSFGLDKARLEKLDLAESRDRETWERSLTERVARSDWLELHVVLHAARETAQLDDLSGRQFEDFLALMFAKKGYQVEKTAVTGDKGADLVLVSGQGTRTAVQAKRYCATVGISAVQEVLGSMAFYRCQRGIVVSTSRFSRDAEELARANGGIELWDRNELVKQIAGQLDVAVPEFSWDDYHRLRASLREPARLRKRRTTMNCPRPMPPQTRLKESE